MARLKRHPIWLIVLTGLIFPRAGWSEEPVPVGYRTIAAERGIPYTVLYAVALTESGKQVRPTDDYRPWPWTLNIGGRGYFFDSRLAAWQALTVSLQAGQRSVDIGLMQVN
ncbi:MAG: lytic transglycosylase domain-containing protein, partial [Pseudomonadota bacterium]|nr:lytic transglycosylase domain-containing protein [Pseudomonadota bacterium]